MRKVYFDKLPAYQFHLLQKFSDQVNHAVFSREGGSSEDPYASLNLSFSDYDKYDNVKKNRQAVCHALKLEDGRLLSMNQVHGDTIQVIDEAFLESFEPFSEINDLDGMVTNLKGVGLMVKIADCQGQIYFDPVKRVIASVHAGWRGLVKDISGRAIKIMKEKFRSDPQNIMVGIAPSLGPCCAFFSNPEKELPENFQKFVDPEKRVNLWEYSIEQLMSHGIQKENIELARVCTMCGGGLKFYSHRRDHGIGGRFGVVISLL